MFEAYDFLSTSKWDMASYLPLLLSLFFLFSFMLLRMKRPLYRCEVNIFSFTKLRNSICLHSVVLYLYIEIEYNSVIFPLVNIDNGLHGFLFYELIYILLNSVS